MSKERMEEFENILEVEGINAKGFGTIAKMVMMDRRLTIQAKGIYSYFCSFAGGGSTAFPSVKKIMYDLNITNKTYYKHFQLLIDFGYISVYQRKGAQGKFQSNLYKLHTNPKAVVENLHNGETVVEKLPCGKNSTMEKLPCGKNSTTNINSIYSFNNNNNKKDINNKRANVPDNFYYDWMAE